MFLLLKPLLCVYLQYWFMLGRESGFNGAKGSSMNFALQMKPETS